MMSALTPFPAPADPPDQTNAGAAANVLRYELIGASQQYPRAKNLVFYLGDGLNESKRHSGNSTCPRVRSTAAPCSATARPTASRCYAPWPTRSACRSSPDGTVPLVGVLTDQGTAIGPPPTVAAADGRTELYWAPLLAAAILVLVELYLVLREFRRTRLANADVVV